jgi:hypothetical protein
MTEKSFWISEQRLFTSNWEDTRDLMLLPDKAQIPIIYMKKRRKYRGRRAERLVRISEWITHLYLFYWTTCSHWRINWMSSVGDYPTNGTLKTNIFHRVKAERLHR